MTRESAAGTRKERTTLPRTAMRRPSKRCRFAVRTVPGLGSRIERTKIPVGDTSYVKPVHDLPSRLYSTRNRLFLRAKLRRSAIQPVLRPVHFGAPGESPDHDPGV